jgi:hypothetical protein
VFQTPVAAVRFRHRFTYLNDAYSIVEALLCTFGDQADNHGRVKDVRQFSPNVLSAYPFG